MKKITWNLGGNIESVTASRSPVWGLVKEVKIPNPATKKEIGFQIQGTPCNTQNPTCLGPRAADKRPPAYAGIDLHKKTLQVEV